MAGRSEASCILVLSMYPPGLVESESTNFLNTDSFNCDFFFVHLRGYSQANAPLASLCLLLSFLLSFLCQAGYVNGKPFWIPVGESFKKNFLEELIFIGDDSSDEQRVTDFPVLLHSTGNTDYLRDDHPPTPDTSRQPDSLPWVSTRPQDKAYLGHELRHHCLLYGPDATSFTQDNSVPSLSAWSPFQVMKSCQATKIFSPQEQINSPRGSRPSRGLGTYGLMFKNRRLSRGIRKEPCYISDKPLNIFPLGHLYRSGSASTTGTLGPDAEKKMPSKTRWQGRWHVITLQEASEYVDHDILTGHYAGCAILFQQGHLLLQHRWSSPSTFMTPGETCLIKSWKENRDGSCKVSFHVPHFVAHQSAAR